MKQVLTVCGAALAGGLLAFTVALPAQDAMGGGDEMAAMMQRWMEHMQPGEQHAGLAKMVGEWDCDVQILMEPGAPMTGTPGKSRIETIMDGRFLTENFSGNFGGMPFRGLGLIGYDNGTKKFSTAWVDNMGTSMQRLTGEGEAGSAIVWRGDRYDPMTGNTVAVRAIMKHVGDDEMVYENFETVDGVETLTMKIGYKRAAR